MTVAEHPAVERLCEALDHTRGRFCHDDLVAASQLLLDALPGMLEEASQESEKRMRDAGLLPAGGLEIEHGIRTQLGDHVAANDDVVLLPKEARLVRSVWRSEWRPVEAGP